MDHAGQGKIQRASHATRMELNRRLHNGELGPDLLPWLNGLDEIQHICADHFDGESVTAKNLSDYRRGAYQKWLRMQQGIEAQRSRAEFALQLARASGSTLSEAAAQLVAGQYLDAFAAAADAGADDPEAAPAAPDPDVAFAVVALRKADQDERKIALKTRELDMREADWAWKTAGRVAAALDTRLAELQAAAADAGDVETRQLNIARVIFGDDLLAKIEARRKEALEA